MKVKPATTDDVINTVADVQKEKDAEKVKDTLKELWYTYSNTTTLHCICHLGNREYSTVRRVFWLFLFLGLLGMFMYEVHILIKRYLEYSAVIKEVTLNENAPDFPTVTICNINRIFNESVTEPEVRTLLLNTYMSHVADIAYFKSLNTTFLNSVNLTHYFVTNPRMESQSTIYCLWNKHVSPCNEYLRPVITSMGVCLAFNSRQYIEEHGDVLRSNKIGAVNNLIVALDTFQEHYFIGDSAAAGFKVLIHDPDEEPSVEEAGVIVSPGLTTYIAMQKTKRIYLPHPVKAFGDIPCTDTKSSSFKNYLQHYDKYSLQACNVECESNYVVNRCGCKGILNKGETRACNAFEVVTCVEEARVNFSSSGMVLCNCAVPCHSTKYNLHVSSGWYPSEVFFESSAPKGSQRLFTAEYARKNMVELRIYFESKLYTQQTQVLEITENDIFGSLGGFMGLCFGASFGTILELAEFFLNLCLHLIRNKTKMKI